MFFVLPGMALYLLVGCSSKEEEPVTAPAPAPTNPVIVDFTPITGPVGTAVVINGLRFSSSQDSNIVRFGGKRSVVDTASTTRLVTSVPSGVIPGPAQISVTVNGQTATGSTFTITSSPETKTVHHLSNIP